MTFPYTFPFTFPTGPSTSPKTSTFPVTGWWAELSGSVAVTVTPVVSATLAHLNVVSVTVTPTVTVSGFLSVSGSSAVTVTPSVVVAGAAVGSVADTVTPTVTASGQPVGAVAATVTPSVSAAGNPVGSSTVTVTPSVTVGGAVIGSGSAAVTVTPTVTVAGSLTTFVGSSSVTVTPTVTAAGGFSGTVSVTVTPTVTVSGILTASGTAGVTVTPTVSATGFLNPVFDAVGAGYLSPTNTSTTTPSWLHTNAGNGAVVFVDLYCSSASPTMSATFGGTTMTPGPSVAYVAGSGFFGYVFSFYLLNPPIGSQSVALSFSAGGAYDVVANSLTYKNVTGFGTGTTNFNSTGSNPSMSATAAVGQMVAQAFGAFTTTLTAYNQTQRYNQALGAASLSFLMGDAAGASSVTFSATGSQPWGGIAIPVQ